MVRVFKKKEIIFYHSFEIKNNKGNLHKRENPINFLAKSSNIGSAILTPIPLIIYSLNVNDCIAKVAG